MSSKLCLIVVDDSLSDIRTLQGAVRRALEGEYSEFEMWPAQNEPAVSSDWDLAWDKIESLKASGFDPDAAVCLLVLDIALGGGIEKVEQGVRKISAKVPHYDRYVVVVSSNVPAAAAALTGIDETITKDFLGREGYLKAKLKNAFSSWRQRNGHERGAARGYRLLDNAAGRRLELALGLGNLDRTVAELVPNWSEIHLEALTGGFSGAFIVRVSENGGQRRSAIWKISTQKTLLEGEITAVSEVLNHQTWAASAAPARTVVEQPNGTNIWVMQQANVAGRTLEQFIHELDSKRRAGKNDKTALRRVMAGIVGILTSSERQWVSHEKVGQMRLSTIDKERALNSISDLVRFRAECIKRGLLSQEQISSAAVVRQFERSVVSEWENAIAGLKPSVMAQVQHGDCNPRNILLQGDGAKLIDFARFGTWPAGYDLCRLQLQLFFRCIPVGRFDDSFGDSLPAGLVSGIALIRGGTGDVPGGMTVGVGSKIALEETWKGVEQLELNFGAQDVRLWIALCKCFDLIKMISYGDATVFRRVIFLEMAIAAAQEAGIVSV